MKKAFSKLLDSYDYTIPAKFIAQAPANPRDSAKLLVFRRADGRIRYDRFKNLSKYLPPHSVVVFNQTKVIPARLTVVKPTGGKVKILYLGTVGKNIEVLADKRLTQGSAVTLGKYSFTVVEQRGSHYKLQPSFPVAKLHGVLLQYGKTPIPPYLRHTRLSETNLRRQYQTVFAKTDGSVAAPTASLHFTKQLLRGLARGGHELKFVTLHVNLGTFAPLTEQELKRRKLHAEYYEIDKAVASFITKARRQRRPIVAVGTTVVRTLESASDAHGRLHKLRGQTQLFIQPGYKFRLVDGLITNFHVPRSSLLMLVAAFVKKDTLFRLYKNARQRRFRFFSFGDGMLIV